MHLSSIYAQVSEDPCFLLEGSVDEVVGCVGSGEALVEVLVLVVDEVLVLLEAVFFVVEELVQLDVPGAVEHFSVLQYS